MIRTALILSVTLTLTAPALAGTDVTVKIETPTEKNSMFIAHKALWKCEGTTCQANLVRNPVSVKTCREVVREIGKVTEYTASERKLSTRQIEKCNAILK